MLLYVVMCLFAFPFTTTEGRFQGANSRTIAKPNCQTRCGNTTVPYPFGIGQDTGCALDDSFYLTCNTSHKHPKLFLQSTANEIYSISNLQLHIFTHISYKCYNTDGDVYEEENMSTDLGIFKLSEKNEMTLIGCDDYALFTGSSAMRYSSGCIGLCTNISDVREGWCSGIGCCRTPIMKGPKFYNVTHKTIHNHTGVLPFNKCSYVFIGEEGSFKFRGKYDISSDASEVIESIRSTVPVLVDWVIRPDSNCSDATECKENSHCYNVHGGGYRCGCNNGYVGNPYLDSGCQDINECENRETYSCFGTCINTPGSYSCTCLPGFSGDAKRKKGCQRNAAKSSKLTWLIFTLGAVLGITGILSLVIIMFKLIQKRKDKKRRNHFFKRNGGLLLQQQTSTGENTVERTRLFNAAELEKATDHYNRNRMIGIGGQGAVYKGMLPNGKLVAVKKSKLVDESQVESFINEVHILSQISHRNVVKLLGCCLETEVPILVYEFVPNGDLNQFLHDENYEFPTLWSIRLQIATEVAGALAYMHSAASIPIYHRDIKSSNILLDEKFRAKLSDFGISMSVVGDQTHLSTAVRETSGYIDPEYFQSSHFTEKSDVYSFGIVLVELLTGKKPIYSTESGEPRSLANLILSTDEGLLLENVDNRVLDAPKEQLLMVAKLAKQCLNLNGTMRPTMREVAISLEGIRSTQ